MPDEWEMLDELSRDLQPSGNLRHDMGHIALRSLAYETILAEVIVRLVNHDQQLAHDILTPLEGPFHLSGQATLAQNNVYRRIRLHLNDRYGFNLD